MIATIAKVGALASAFVALSIAGLLGGGREFEHKFGSNEDIGANYEDVWSGGGDYSWITNTSGTALQVSSSATTDDSGNTGAITMTVVGLDANFDPIDATFVLNGRSAVTTSTVFRRVQRAYVTGAGTSETNDGTIYVSDSGAALTNGVPDVVAARRAIIAIGEGQTQQAVYTVPDDFDASLLDLHVGGDDDTKATTFQLMMREAGGAWRVQWTGTSNGQPFEKVFSTPVKFKPRTDLRVRAKSSVGTQTGQASFELSLK